MPKGSKGRRSKNNPRSRDLVATSDEDSLNDNASVSSVNSEIRNGLEEGGEDVDEQSQVDQFEEKFANALDNLLEKSVQTRVLALESLSKALSCKYIPDFIYTRRVTIQDAIERCLKKGRGGQEQSMASQLVALMCIQLGEVEEADILVKELSPILNAIAFDKTAPALARSKCCSSLALSSFLCNEMADVVELMQSLERVFAGSYLKGDGTVPLITAEIAHLHASAISAWGLLVTLMSPGYIYMLMSSENAFMPQIDHLTQLLESSHLEVRMAAGDAIALAYELGRTHDEAFREEESAELCDKLRQLATDSHKYRAKKDRKQQRSSFRDILHFIEEGNPPDIQVRFGQEMLPLDSWSRKRQYDAFCQVLGSGINLHLTENDLLRDVFQLGEKVTPVNSAALKKSKIDRHHKNAANSKARTISRNKNRDKRFAGIIC